MDSKDIEEFEVLIVGGGPAGLSAALVLGRARRQVLVCDSGQYRNAASKAMHGFLTRNGVPPSEFLSIAQEEVAAYPNVRRWRNKVLDIRPQSGKFRATLNSGKTVIARKVILATGLIDLLPPVSGAEDIYGHGLHHCPYCDGYEVQDQPLIIYGRGDQKGAGLALEMLQWSRSLVLCTDGPSELSPEVFARLQKFSIVVDERRLKHFKKSASGVEVAFKEGEARHCKAVFFNIGTRKASDLAEKLGCEIVSEDAKPAERIAGKTCISGVYIIGDASRDVLQVIVAAGEGSAAAIAINAELLRDDEILF